MKPISYKGFRLSRLNEPQFKHIWFLLYWLFYGIVFWTLEQGVKMNYHTIWCPLDDKIPFCEFFVIPYYFWFFFIFWIIIYGFFYDIKSFNKFHMFVILTYSITLVIYILYPNQQCLRPQEYARDNIFVDIAKLLYSYDTNTNVCPSIHIIGSMAVMFTAWHSERYSTKKWRIAFLSMTFLICLSPLFLRQHSIIDVILGLIISFLAYPLVFRKKEKKNS